MIAPNRPVTGAYDDIIRQVLSQPGSDINATNWMLGVANDSVTQQPLTREQFRQNVPGQTYEPLQDMWQRALEEMMSRSTRDPAPTSSTGQ